MKSKLLFALAAILWFSVSAFSQTVVGPLTNNAREYIWQSGSSQLLGDNVLMYLGKPVSSAYRDFFQWDLPDNILPDGVHITQVKLEFTAYPQGGSPQLQADIYKINYDITGSTPAATLYAAAENQANIIGSGQALSGTWSVTFPKGNFTAAIESSLVNNKFALAIRSSYEILYNYWHYVPSGSAKLTIWVAPVTVTVDQQRAVGSRLSGTTVGRWNGSSFTELPITSNADTISLNVGSREVFRGSQQQVINPSEKYRVWRRNTVDQLDTVQNHRGFTIIPSDNNFISRFNPTNPNATIKTDLLDAPSTTGGSIQFHDPWYVDYQDPQYGNNWRNRGMVEPRQFYNRNVGTGGFTPDTTTVYPQGPYPYRGVFLNENTQWDPLKPNYSVGAPNPDTINNHTSYFVKWDDSNPTQVGYQNAYAQQTGVVFKQSGATAVAKYKAYLRSSSSSVTGPNTQRKIIRDANGAYHMVYESANHIWYCKSSDGINWGPEVRLSEDYYSLGAALNHTPSMTVQSSPHLMLVVWEVDESNNTLHDVYFCTVNPATGVRQTYPEVIGISSGSPIPLVASGVATDGTIYDLVAYFDVQSRSIMALVRRASNGSWVGNAVLRQADASALSLAPISYGTASENSKWHLVWLEGGNLWYGSIPIAATPAFSRTEVVAYGDPETFSIQNPSLAVVYDGWKRPALTWDEYDASLHYRVVKYTERGRVDGSGWDAPTVWSAYYKTPSNYVTPSLSVNYTSPNVSIAWLSGASQLMSVQRNGSVWTAKGNLTTGVDPMASIGWTSSLTEKILSRGTTSLYPIQTSTLTYTSGQAPALAMAPSAAPSSGGLPEGRGGRVIFAKGMFEIVLLQASLDGLSIPFTLLNDTLPVLSEGVFEAALSTEAFSGKGTLRLEMLHGSRGQLPSTAGLKLLLRDASTSEALATLRVFGAATDSVRSLTVPLPYAGRTLCLSVQPVGTVARRAYQVERWYAAPDVGSQALAKLNSGQEADLQMKLVPDEFAFHSNFPNPFNPSTTINYDLPVAGNVSLVVYDVLGRMVVELASGQYEAGYHSVTWNASNAASGIYFARFTVSGAMGKAIYMKVNKLVLMK
jgi:hypothetical protein